MDGCIYCFNDLASRVNKSISADDIMYQNNVEHYHWCGESGLRVLLHSIGLAGDKIPEKVLDFGAGAGRVTRWLTAAFPSSKIDACDAREQDMEFLRASLGIHAWTVGTDVSSLSIS